MSTAERVERAMWLGNLLPFELGCHCHEGRPHHTREYSGNPIVDHACEFPAGSAYFFETDFNRAFQQVPHLEAQVSPPSPLMTVIEAMSYLAWESHPSNTWISGTTSSSTAYVSTCVGASIEWASNPRALW